LLGAVSSGIEGKIRLHAAGRRRKMRKCAG
jgi:hypothetical protein